MRLAEPSITLGKGLWVVLIAVALIRLASLGAYPLTDTTEARYGEIARWMAATGDWITPWISPEKPFWGKPPLSFWLSAASMKLFGVNEFAARLPSWLLGVLVSFWVWGLAHRQINKADALSAIVILNTIGVFWISSGAVMTDPSLLAGTTLCMAAFWRAVQFPEDSGRLWGYAFFGGMAIGLLSKGPVALVLTGLPIAGWTLLRWKWREVWTRLPWIWGLLLTAALSFPWYWLAEMKTPGFLEYFIIGEHWKRFLVSGWAGDLYGTAHHRPMGMIWLFWLACALPWPIVGLAMYLRTRQRRFFSMFRSRPDDWTLYLMLWAMAPMVFFTLSRNILPAYVLPGIPAFALLMAQCFRPVQEGRKASSNRGLLWTSAAMLMMFTLALFVVSLGYGLAGKSQKDLVATFQKSRQDQNSHLVYLFKQPISARFYSSGAAEVAALYDDIAGFSNNGEVDYFALPADRMKAVPPSFLDKVMDMGRFNRYYLFKEKDS